jgi:heme exporter protein A
LARARQLALVRGGRLLFEGLEIGLGAGDGLLLTGPNGAGKSSLLRIAAGLLKPSGGTFEHQGAALADEGLALDRELTLERALSFWGGPRLKDAIAQFGLGELLAVPVRMLSTGQAKRARLARVMASGAPLWLLDEPLNGLDRAGLAALDEAVASHRASGGGVIAASHLPLSGDWERLEMGS